MLIKLETKYFTTNKFLWLKVCGDTAASFSGFNNRANVLKTCKTCAQQNGLDIIATTSIFGKGNFDEATDANKVGHKKF